MIGKNIRQTMLDLIDKYEGNEIDAEFFVAAYQELWRQWRDSEDRMSMNEGKFPVALDRVFTAADCFKPKSASFRLRFELDEDQLKIEVRDIWKYIQEL